jgi:hypothetical protein
MSLWPQNIPPDLRRALDRALSMRNCSAPDVWGEVRDWLVAHGVRAPADLAEDLRPEGPNEIKP